MWFPSGILVGAIWLAKEIGALVLKDTASRLGKIGYVRENSELLDRVVDREGTPWDTHYARRDGEPIHELRFVATGHLVNESGTPLLLQEPKVAFWAADGLRVRHVSPRVSVSGTPTTVVTIPAHGTVPIKIEIGVMTDILLTTYLDAIPILQFETSRGKSYQFALRAFPMWRGEGDLIGWDARRNKVVRAGTRDFARAQARGALGPVRGR